MPGTSRPGRRPKHALVRNVEGHRGHRPIPKELEPRGRPKLPAHLGPAERMVWSRVLAAMPAGVITDADEALLEAYCNAVVVWREADAMIRKNGLLVRGPNGEPQQNPLLRVKNRAFGEMRGAAIELGLSPAARTKIQAPEIETGDPMELLLSMDEEGYAGSWSGRRQ